MGNKGYHPSFPSLVHKEGMKGRFSTLVFSLCGAVFLSDAAATYGVV
jgi:hypothetical protein